MRLQATTRSGGENMDKLQWFENKAWESAREKDLDGFSFWVRQWERWKVENNLHGIQNPFKLVYQEIESIAYQVAAENGQRISAV